MMRAARVDRCETGNTGVDVLVGVLFRAQLSRHVTGMKL